MKAILPFVATMALAACNGQTSGPSPLAKLATFTVADLAAAEADAKAHNDVIAAACYPALSKFVTDLQAAGGGATVSGAFSAFQKARDAVKASQTGLPTDLVLGCAPLVQDATGDALGFQIKLAGLVAGGTAVAPVVGLLGK